MGSLFLACQGGEGMEKLCVVKTVLPQLADKEYLARFRDEAKVVVRLSHGNLVPVFDAGAVGGEIYIAMDFVDGKDLRAVWNRCAKKGIAFPIDVAVYITRELARGLHHAHTAGSMGLVHRDVSPPNVLLAFSGEAKLTDFGLAASTLKLEHTAPGIIYGKVSYMSPEQARGETLDGRSDLYSVVVILWELLTGRQLFPANDTNVLDRVRQPKIDAPSRRAPRVPPRLDAIVMKALAPAREDRYADCEELRTALAEFLAREAPTTDNARVASFLENLFGEEIEEERAKREELVERSRLMPHTQRAGESAAPPAGAAKAASAVQNNDPNASLIGSILGERYRVLRLMGEGGMGRVFEAEHIEIGKRVAIKLLHPAYSRAPELVERFRREARAASRIGHPNIVDVTDSGATENGSVFFVMEYLEGRDLAEVIRSEKRFAVERAVTIAIQLARALQAAHASGIVHRDLKPENVFLATRLGQLDLVKVLDFGIARRLDIDGVAEGRLTDPGLAMGTPEYMAPEQATGQSADVRVDIYAVGAILYEMLAGHPPHEGNTFIEVLSKKANTPAIPLHNFCPEVSAQLSQTVNRALARLPEDRQQTMEELALDLERSRPDRRTGSPGRAAARSFGHHEAWSKIRAHLWKRPYITLGLAFLLPFLAAVSIVYLASHHPAPARQMLTPKENVSVVAPPPRAVKHVEPPTPAVSAEIRPTTTRSKAELRRPLDDAYRLLKAGKLDAAEAALQHEYEAGSDPGACLTGLAEVALQRGSYAQAIRRGERALKHGAGVPARMVLGEAHAKVRDFDAAARDYREVLRQQPGNREAQRRLAEVERKASGN